eukprot:CAMPEP_0170495752 /NCGR_PEP_ID=MMETSP0208-20121228/18343_1 /TAXON_ID=197538 /ORGANISM="Strombidium inclinatum, Strain S3" /LENGTH=76 /DNA_ID=CAMNT_0010772101 /DNA_START=75 /DNA_END=305 /DNA_ORIENTATION=-
MNAFVPGEEDEVQDGDSYPDATIKASFNVQLHDRLAWDDLPRTGTEIDLDEEEENEIQDKEYSAADIKSSSDIANL